MKKRILLLIFILALPVIAAIFHHSGLAACLHAPEALRDWVLSFSPMSEAVFFLLQLAAVVIAPIPGSLIAAAGGMCFGFRLGSLLTLTAVTLGSCLTFALARTLGRSWAQGLAQRHLPQKYRSLLRRKGSSFLFLAFLFPFFPDDLLCIAAGLTDIPPRRFLLLVVLARPWGLLAATGTGAALPGLPGWVMALMAALGGALFWLGMKYGDAVKSVILGYFRQSRGDS